MLLIYSTSTTNRLLYISELIADTIGISQRVTENVEEYVNYDGPVINYSDAAIKENEIWIQPVSLLFENDIQPQIINVFKIDEQPAFFKSNGSFSFDLFAASFYLITRYEEYLPHQLDMYGRFAHENSIAYKYGFLKSPLINIWIDLLKKKLLIKFPSFQFTPRSFRFIPTYDIDIAWSYLHKGVVRNAGGVIRSLLKGSCQEIKERAQVLLKTINDPFEVYNWLDKLHEEKQIEPIYFFLLSTNNKGYDKNISPLNKGYKSLIRNHSNKYSVGIHPSWQSGDDEYKLKEEISLLKTITGENIIRSRQHYIRMKLPNTYRQLIQAGISQDYSMGYGSINGFRASYCLPFKWFDLEKNEVTNLTIFPFCYMEANSIFEQKDNAEQAIEELRNYYTVIKELNGVLITIFHNHLVTEQPAQLPWRNMYARFMNEFVL